MSEDEGYAVYGSSNQRVYILADDSPGPFTDINSIMEAVVAIFADGASSVTIAEWS